MSGSFTSPNGDVADDVPSIQPPGRPFGPSDACGVSLPDPLATLDRIATALERIADHLAPEPADIVGSGYVSQRLGVTVTWIAEMARRGDIPKSCIVAGTGNGKLWRFHRGKIDQWLSAR